MLGRTSRGWFGDWLIPGSPQNVEKTRTNPKSKDLNYYFRDKVADNPVEKHWDGIIFPKSLNFILQLIWYIIGFRLGLGAPGADLLWRL